MTTAVVRARLNTASCPAPRQQLSQIRASPSGVTDAKRTAQSPDGVSGNDSCSPIPPRVGEQHPKQSISVVELGTPHGALEHGQLLTECQILERDRSVSAADQRETSKRDDERSQHELSCPAISHRINRNRRSDSGDRQSIGLLDHTRKKAYLTVMSTS